MKDLDFYYVLLIFIANIHRSFSYSRFSKNVDESNCKPNKIWVDKGNEFYNRSMKSFLLNNDTEIYSRYNEGKSVIVEIFVRTFNNKSYTRLQFQKVCILVN